MTGDESEELTVGVLGAGLIAGVHAWAYRDSPGVRVAAVADPVPGKAELIAEQYAAQAVTGLEELLELGVDIVDVCTPPMAHAQPTIRALEAGRHVFCEKPLTRTMEEARAVVRAAESAPGLLMIGHVTRYEPDHRSARDLVAAGEIGGVRMLTHSVTSTLPGWTEAGWLTDPALSGGPLLDQAVHSFDYARWVAGAPAVRVTCFSADTPAGPGTYAVATVRYANDAIATVECSWAHPAARGFKLAAEIVGTQGRLTWSNSEQMGGVLHPREGDTEWWDVLSDRGFRLELRTFVEAVRAGASSPVTASEATEALRTALAALESARSGRTVDLTTWEVS